MEKRRPTQGACLTAALSSGSGSAEAEVLLEVAEGDLDGPPESVGSDLLRLMVASLEK